MPVGNIVRYNQFPRILLEDGNPQWDDPAPGAFMWVLCDNGYTPYVHHVTLPNGTSFIASAPGAPINCTGRIVEASAGSAVLKAESANFGLITLPAKYLLCVMPVVAGVFYQPTTRLCFYVDLDTTSPTAQLPANTEINLIAANGIFGVLG